MGVQSNIGRNAFPRQGGWLGKRARVCFNYDTEATIGGTCVRDDAEEPHRTIFLLDDGRHVLSTECQFSLQDTERLDLSSPLKRIAAAYGAVPEGTGVEEELLGLLLRKVEADERALAELDAKLRAAAANRAVEGPAVPQAPRANLTPDFIDQTMRDAPAVIREVQEQTGERMTPLCLELVDRRPGTHCALRRGHEGKHALADVRDVRVTFTDPATGVEHVVEHVSGELFVAGPDAALPAFVADMRAPDFTGVDADSFERYAGYRWDPVLGDHVCTRCRGVRLLGTGHAPECIFHGRGDG